MHHQVQYQEIICSANTVYLCVLHGSQTMEGGSLSPQHGVSLGYRWGTASNMEGSCEYIK